MPEGPEIRRAADKIAAKLTGQVVETVWFGLPRLEQFAAQLTGRRVVELETRGKALLIHFEHGLSLYSHNQLYGRWFVRSRESYPKTNRSLRVALHTAEASALLYSASEIAVLDERGLGEHPFLSRIGPDLLSRDFSPQALVARLRGRRFRNRALGSLYLDQRFVAGIGNYLRSEILYFARVHPKQRPSDLEAAEQRKLASETIAVSARAYKLGGITNTPHRVAQLKKKGFKRRDYRHAVFGRAGKPCYRCGTEVEKLSVASRRLYLCPTCQGV
ncbi:MAG: endonuclease VIII [Polyangiales bacterium]